VIELMYRFSRSPRGCLAERVVLLAIKGFSVFGKAVWDQPSHHDTPADKPRYLLISKEAAGKVFGDKKLETEGKTDKAAGKVQNAVGGLKDVGWRARTTVRVGF